MSVIWLSALMKRRTIPVESPLKNVRIASPCRANWGQMIGDDRVRHCAECNLNVYNLSEMTRREAEELIASREGQLCVRFFRRADGTILTRNCPVGLRNAVRRVSRFAGTALSAVMSVGFSAAQTSPKGSTQANVQNDQKKGVISIVVTDPHGGIVSGANVKVVDEATGIVLVGTTRSDGSLQLSLSSPGSYRLNVIAQGFKTYQEKLSIAQSEARQITAKLKTGKASDNIEVGGISAPLVEAETSQVTATFPGSLLQTLP